MRGEHLDDITSEAFQNQIPAQDSHHSHQHISHPSQVAAKKELIKNIASEIRKIAEQASRPFYLANGVVVKSLEELRSAARSMTVHTFNAHVTSQRNDFSDWVARTYGFHELALLISSAKTPDELATAIQLHLSINEHDVFSSQDQKEVLEEVKEEEKVIEAELPKKLTASTPISSDISDVEKELIHSIIEVEPKVEIKEDTPQEIRELILEAFMDIKKGLYTKALFLHRDLEKRITHLKTSKQQKQALTLRLDELYTEALLQRIQVEG